ncbi:hypothetical protein FDP41_008016 [Naegleria fowleri]|uniref:Uncharacterized protein n=1 Tax=Naegleria fowleri TaxID=5763 RepID=A0A6A5CA58_NAEFO|nr:uncharacterized protein FDP41_008016 [Naegleria fowleri]KAF0984101.1 hypothetical protein FDP41_008016 [Naegleria fowleri]
MIEKEYDYLYKIVVIGDSAVGKSSLIVRFAKNEFKFNTKPTIGVDFASKDITYDSKCILGHIWDTAGQEKYQATAPALYRGALGAMIVFDISNRQSFENLERWLTQLKKYGEPDCVNIIVGNKSDLQHLRQVSVEEASQYAQKHGAYYMETSALNASNVEKAFSSLLQNIYLKKPTPIDVYNPPPQNPNLPVVPSPGGGVQNPSLPDPTPVQSSFPCQC